MSHYVLEAAGASAPNVHIWGNQAPDVLFPALAAADIVALPSIWEAFGIAALEAMALGKPVILTSGSGYDDFATNERNALVVPPRDAQALANAILRLVEDPALSVRLGGQAACTADHLDVPRVARAHAQYFHLIRGEPAPAETSPHLRATW